MLEARDLAGKMFTPTGDSRRSGKAGLKAETSRVAGRAQRRMHASEPPQSRNSSSPTSQAATAMTVSPEDGAARAAAPSAAASVTGTSIRCNSSSELGVLRPLNGSMPWFPLERMAATGSAKAKAKGDQAPKKRSSACTCAAKPCECGANKAPHRGLQHLTQQHREKQQRQPQGQQPQEPPVEEQFWSFANAAAPTQPCVPRVESGAVKPKKDSTQDEDLVFAELLRGVVAEQQQKTQEQAEALITAPIALPAADANVGEGTSTEIGNVLCDVMGIELSERDVPSLQFCETPPPVGEHVSLQEAIAQAVSLQEADAIYADAEGAHEVAEAERYEDPDAALHTDSETPQTDSGSFDGASDSGSEVGELRRPQGGEQAAAFANRKSRTAQLSDEIFFHVEGDCDPAWAASGSSAGLCTVAQGPPSPARAEEWQMAAPALTGGHAAVSAAPSVEKHWTDWAKPWQWHRHRQQGHRAQPSLSREDSDVRARTESWVSVSGSVPATAETPSQSGSLPLPHLASRATVNSAALKAEAEFHDIL